MEEEAKIIFSTSKIPEEGKIGNVPAFSAIKKHGPCSSIPEVASKEWELVKTQDDAVKWHLKWTPWFTPQMIEGIVKYGYSSK